MGNLLKDAHLTHHQRVHVSQNKFNSPADGSKRSGYNTVQIKLPKLNPEAYTVKMSTAQRLALIHNPQQRLTNKLVDSCEDDHFKTVSQIVSEVSGPNDFALNVSKRNFKRKTPFTQWSNAYYSGGVFFNPPVNGI